MKFFPRLLPGLLRVNGNERLFSCLTRYRQISSLKLGILALKLAKEFDGLPAVMPAESGHPEALIFLDSGSR
jgi:hypothetical protein